MISPLNFRHKFSLCVALALAFATAGFGQFTGEFSLPTISTTFNNNQSNLTEGGWLLNLTANNGGSIDTTGGPASLFLSATGAGGNNGFGAGTSTLTLSHVAASTSTVSFDLSAAGAVFVTVDGSPVSAVSGTTFAFNLASGSTLALGVTATGFAGTFGVPGPGGPGGPPIGGTPGSPSTGSLTISNFADVAAIPEPQTWTAVVGMCGLGFAAWRRRGPKRA